MNAKIIRSLFLLFTVVFGITAYMLDIPRAAAFMLLITYSIFWLLDELIAAYREAETYQTGAFTHDGMVRAREARWWCTVPVMAAIALLFFLLLAAVLL